MDILQEEIAQCVADFIHDFFPGEFWVTRDQQRMFSDGERPQPAHPIEQHLGDRAAYIPFIKTGVDFRCQVGQCLIDRDLQHMRIVGGFGVECEILRHAPGP